MAVCRPQALLVCSVVELEAMIAVTGQRFRGPATAAADGKFRYSTKRTFPQRTFDSAAKDTINGEPQAENRSTSVCQ